MKCLLRTVAAVAFGISFITSVHAAMRPFVMDSIKVFCSPLCVAGPDALIVELTEHPYHWRAHAFFSQLNSDVVVSLLKAAAQENRPDIVERILKECNYDFDLETIDYLLVLADGYEWPGPLVRALEAKKALLIGSNQVPVDTRSDPE
ncbi:MAG: hypothetical protein WC365_00275 [Candidatus Babeliales bacterium]|jgi:hypothetical protein